LDDLSTGSKSNIQQFERLDNFKFIKHDVQDPLDLNIDMIFNLACPASPIQYQLDPIRTTKTSLFGAINMLDLAEQQKAKIFHASTSEVYGDPDVHPQPETYLGKVNPIGMRACYDEGKRCAETLFFDYNRQRKVDIRVARIFNTYGPKMSLNDGRVVSNFIVQALKGENLTVFGSGLQTRSFCYVSDLIDAFELFMDPNITSLGPINIGNPVENTMLELAEKVLLKIGGSSKLIFVDLPEDDPKQRRPDITIAKQTLNWEPQITLDEGLDKTIHYFSNIV
jgi:UDP-glucuronate decarboxylase